ncbi:MAG: hypothetical protein ACRCZD_08805 [Phycicoccus sp.]
MTSEVIEARIVDGGARRRPGPAVVCVVLLAVTALGVLLSRIALDGDQPTWAVLFGTITIMLLIFLAGYIAAVIPGRRGVVRARQRGDELDLVGSPWPMRGEVLAAMVALVGTVLGAVVLVRRDEVSNVTAAGPVVVLAGLAASATWPAVKYVTGRRPVDFLSLGRRGFTVRSRGRAESFAWADATGFAVGLGGLTVQVLGYEGTSVPIPAAGLRSDAALVARLLEYYRTHERERAELSSGAALDRLRDGQLP